MLHLILLIVPAVLAVASYVLCKKFKDENTLLSIIAAVVTVLMFAFAVAVFVLKLGVPKPAQEVISDDQETTEQEIQEETVYTPGQALIDSVEGLLPDAEPKVEGEKETGSETEGEKTQNPLNPSSPAAAPAPGASTIKK